MQHSLMAMMAAALILPCAPMYDAGSGIDPVSLVSDSDGDAAEAVAVSSCDVAEIFSPPRLCPRAHHFGLIGGFSHDLITGVDLSTCDGRAHSWSELQEAQPTVLMVCPPCT